MAIQLQGVVSSWIDREGVQKAAEELKKGLDKSYSAATLNNWKSRTGAPPPLAVAQFVLDNSRVELKTDDEPFEGAKIFIGSCVYRDVSPWTYKATHVLRYRYGDQLGLLMETGTDLAIKRNRLADRFLKTDGEWLLWLDDDMAPPIGYPSESTKWGAKFSPDFNSADVLERLMSHKVSLVGALYFDRGGQGIPMYAEGRNNTDLAEQIRKGPQDKIIPTDWTGAGCTLVHRRVFEDMLEKLPDIRTKNHMPNGYFTPIGHGYGEDVSFAIRAKSIGHQPHVDLGCVCGHAGPVVHYNEKIR